MPSSRARSSRSIGTKSTQLALAVPQVMAHRLTRMAIAGTPQSKRDQKEFKLMVDEKKTAFTESWAAMASQAVAAQQTLALSMMRAFWAPALGRRPASAASVAQQWHNAALGVLDKGLGPVHRKATANARRLAKTKLR
jgi:hypothetical protein